VGHMVLYRLLFASLGFAPVTWRGLRRAETRLPRGHRLILMRGAGGHTVRSDSVRRLAYDVSHPRYGRRNTVLLAAASAIFNHST